MLDKLVVRPHVAASDSPIPLLTVEEAFLITGRGLVLTPGLREIPSIPMRPGDKVRLECSDGTYFESSIKGIDAVHNRNTATPEIHFFITLPAAVEKKAVPRGTKLVWLGVNTGNSGTRNE